MGYACRHHPLARAGPAAAALTRPWLVLLLASCCAAAWTKRSSSLVEVEPAESADSAAEDLEQPRSSLVEMGSTKLAESAKSAEDLEQPRSSLVEVESAKPAESAKFAEDLEQPRSSLVEVESAEPAESATSAEDLEQPRSSLAEVEPAESAEHLEQPRSSLAEVEAAEPAESAERPEQPRSSLLVESAESTEGLEQPPGSSLVEVDPALPIRRPTPPTTPRPGVWKRIKNFFSYKWRQHTGDGVNELYFPPNEVVLKRAASRIRGAYDCQILLNQYSVFWFFWGDVDDELPYRRWGDQTRLTMAGSNRVGSWDAQGVENEGAIFNCLKDPPRCEFPYMPTNDHLKRAATELERAWSARVIVNQLAIYQLIQCTFGPCGVEPVMHLPYPPDEAIQKRSRLNMKGMFDAQQIMNQKAIWERAQEWSQRMRAQGTPAAAAST